VLSQLDFWKKPLQMIFTISCWVNSLRVKNIEYLLGHTIGSKGPAKFQFHAPGVPSQRQLATARQQQHAHTQQFAWRLTYFDEVWAPPLCVASLSLHMIRGTPLSPPSYECSDSS
jgi:hypothetical protein